MTPMQMLSATQQVYDIWKTAMLLAAINGNKLVLILVIVIDMSIGVMGATGHKTP